MRFHLSKIIEKILNSGVKEQDYSFSDVDVCIASDGSIHEEKFKFLNELWNSGIRAEANYSEDVTDVEYTCKR